MRVASLRSARARFETSSDAQLLTRVSRGDLGALGVLYDRYHADVWRVLCRLADGTGEVDDLVQSTFLALPRLAATFDGRDSCRGWLCSIAAGLAARHRRSVARLLRKLVSFGETASASSTRTPERDAGTREQLRVFENALRALPGKKREAFVLVEIEGVPIEEVARALGVPAGTVRTRLFHARRELRDVMKGGEA
jgi:RNA polymerase sigma-70 factor (ECF subfamily)